MCCSQLPMARWSPRLATQEPTVNGHRPGIQGCLCCCMHCTSDRRRSGPGTVPGGWPAAQVAGHADLRSEELWQHSTRDPCSALLSSRSRVALRQRGGGTSGFYGWVPPRHGSSAAAAAKTASSLQGSLSNQQSMHENPPVVAVLNCVRAMSRV